MLLSCVYHFNRILGFLHNALFDKRAKVGDFLDEEQTIEYLSDSRKSLIRLGDGESTILTGGSLESQGNSIELWRSLRKIVTSYNEQSPYVIALPHRFLVETKKSLQEIQKYRIWGKTRYIYDHLLSNQNIPYLDAFSFRKESRLTIQQIESLWRDEARIFFLHNSARHYTNFCMANQGKEVVFVEIQSTNSFGDIGSTLDRISVQMKMRDWSPCECCALVSAGPAAKVLVFEFSRMGIRALDMGHYFDHKAD